MSYIGRKGQTAPLASADLPTNSISTAHLINDAVTSAKIGVDVIVAEDIAANAITVAEIADDAVTGAKLANDIAITTTGALTGTVSDFNWDSNTLVVDSSESRVGVGTVTPNVPLHIDGFASGMPVTSGTTQTYGGFRLQNSNQNTLDFGWDQNKGAWIQTGYAPSLIPGNTYSLLLNPNGGKVGIGTSAPDERLHVMESSAGSVTAHSESSIVAERSGNSFINILGSSTSGLLFGDAGGNETGRINYEFSAQAMKFYTENAERLRIDGTGHLIHNGAKTYSTSWYSSLGSVLTFDIPITNSVHFFLIQCGMGYYPSGSYTTSLYGWYAFRSDSGVGQVTDIATQSSSNSGSFSVSNTSSTNLRITKNAGVSSANARGFIRVVWQT